MVITVVDRSTDTAITLENVDLDGNALGDFGVYDVPGTPGFQISTITGFDFSQSWTLTGDLRVAGLTHNETDKVEIDVGCPI
jgi:hypothetical protein